MFFYNIHIFYFYFLNFLVISTIEEAPFIMHHLSPVADDAVPGTSSNDHTYEEIKDEMLGIIIKINKSCLTIKY